jgi:predicted PurR-regulated permease PerM
VNINNAFRVGLVGTLGVGLGLLLLSAIGSLATVLTYIGVALFLSLGLDPLVKWLETKKIPRWGAILIVVVAVLVIVVGVLLLVIPTLVEQAISFASTVPDLIKSLKTQDWINQLDVTFGNTIDVQAILTAASDFFKDPSNLARIAGGALVVGAGIATGVTGTIVVVILTLYFTASLQTIKNTAYSLVPRSKRDTFIRLSEEITGGVGKYVMGQIVLAMLNGALTFILLTVIGGRGAAIFAFIAFMMALIPLVGTVIGSTIIVLGELLVAGPQVAIIATIYYLIYMQIEAYVLSPKIMNKAVSIPGSIVVIAALAGGTLMGILGALVAIPIAASIILIIKEIVIPAQEES